MFKKLLLLSLIFLLFLPVVFAQEEANEVDLLFFYGQGCPACASAEPFLEELESAYSNLNIIRYEIYHNKENARLFYKMSQAYGIEDLTQLRIPSFFINGKIIIGISQQIAESIVNEIERCSSDACESPLEQIEQIEANETVQIIGEGDPTEYPKKTELKKRLTLGAVIGAAAIDAINPCAFAVLIILLTTVLASGARKRALFAGLAFTISIYISYFLMGLGLYSAIRAAGLTRIFYVIVAILAILVGLFNLKDYFWYGRWFIMEVPISWRPKMKALIRSVTSVPGAFLIGFVVSLFLLPCTSGPYIVILGFLAEATSHNYALMLLLLYNFIFVLPMLLITAAVYLRFTTTEKAERWRTGHLKVLHLIAGVIILLLGIGMLVAVFGGFI